MAKTGLLSPLKVQRETRPGRYGDGGGLYLQVRPIGGAEAAGKPKVSRNWLFRYSFEGKAKMVGLGAFSGTNSLAAARKRAERLRALLDTGVDPQAMRDAERQERREQAARALTFKQAVKEFIAMRSDWKTEKHKAKWLDLLERYAFPLIGDIGLASVDKGLLLKVLQQEVEPLRAPSDGRELKPGGALWKVRPETAKKVRNRMEQVFDWAHAAEKRKGENPARWRGNMKELLGRNLAKRQRKHHKALPYQDAPGFIAELRKRQGTEVASLALEYLILTTTRTNETLGARWADEFNDALDLWTIPKARMKAERDHLVPLSAPATAILKAMRAMGENSEFVFPGRKRGKPLSTGALAAVLRRMGRNDATVHGMRSVYRDWVAEETNFQREAAEVQLAHAVAGETEEAYWRSKMLQKRRLIVDAWAAYCGGTNVVQFPRAVA